MNSLKARLLLAATILLAVFMTLTGFALDRALYQRAEQAEQDKLQGLLYSILGAAEVDAEGKLTISSEKLVNPSLLQPDSGLYSYVLDADGGEVWRSSSLLRDIVMEAPPEVGVWQFNRVTDELGNPHYAITFAVNWQAEDEQAHRYTFAVVEETGPFNRQMHMFRGTMLGWLAASAVVLLIVQLLVLRWGLMPLGKLLGEVREIESGEKEHVDGRYQDELRPLTEGLNAMLRSERAHQKRYRNALDDLAHSLKTPLAVLNGLCDSSALATETRERLTEQLERMGQIVGYQLQKASTTGQQPLLKPQLLRPMADKIVLALEKVYKKKAIRYQVDIPDDLKIRADEGDILELLGNLLDNASKWCEQSVLLHAVMNDQLLMVEVADDGSGFPPDQVDILLKRGMRADTRTEGQGIGLSVVAEIVAAYEGDISLGKSAHLGGAEVRLSLPIA